MRADEMKQSVLELEAKFLEHKRLLANYMGGEGESDSSGTGHFLSYKMRYKMMLKSTIEELEQTRKSFKSRQVEGLRKRLTRELADID